ncbi:MAG: glycosyltransferase family 2 protein [Acidobacteriota bacterium]
MKKNGNGLISIIIPCFNEERTIERIIRRVHQTKYKKEIIAINDGSTDRSGEILENLKEKIPDLKVISHPKNMGKGAAIRTALEHVNGDIVIIQDADLEYDPVNYPKLLSPILEGKADVVYGSRFVGSEAHRVLFFWHYMGNRILTLLSNMMTNLNLTDMETGYKVFRAEVLKRIKIEQNRFGFEPEITAKVSKLKARVYEVGISYYGRNYSEGKKITWKDGLLALWYILKYRVKKL